MDASLYLADIIKAEREKLRAIEEETSARITALQTACTHPRATKEAKANTGGYDRGSDHYWYEFKCPDCGKFWSVDQ